MKDLRQRVRSDGINMTWLAERLSEKTGARILQPRLQVVLKGELQSVGAVFLRRLVEDYLDKLERLNAEFFTKEKGE